MSDLCYTDPAWLDRNLPRMESLVLQIVPDSVRDVAELMPRPEPKSRIVGYEGRTRHGLYFYTVRTRAYTLSAQSAIVVTEMDSFADISRFTMFFYRKNLEWVKVPPTHPHIEPRLMCCRVLESL